MALLEAMLAGKAIVASAIAGIPEAIVSGREGLLVPPADAAVLADALRLLLADPARRTVLGEAAAERAKRDFTVAVMATRYQALYGTTKCKRHRTESRILGVRRLITWNATRGDSWEAAR
jgi:glycosyltransferase involved in cell wall biosynthesis